MPQKPSIQLARWPIVEPGLYMDLWGNLFVTILPGTATAREIDIYFAELARSIDARTRSKGLFGFLMSVGDGQREDKDFMRRQGQVLKERSTILRETTAAFVMLTDSWIARVATRVVFTLAPPPYPYAIKETAGASFAYLSQQGITFDPGDIEAFQQCGARVNLFIP